MCEYSYNKCRINLKATLLNHSIDLLVYINFIDVDIGLYILGIMLIKSFVPNAPFFLPPENTTDVFRG